MKTTSPKQDSQSKMTVVVLSIIVLMLIVLLAPGSSFAMIGGVRDGVGTQKVNGLVTIRSDMGGSCSGVLYKDIWVITSGHCLQGGLYDIEFYGGKYHQSSSVNFSEIPPYPFLGMIKLPERFAIDGKVVNSRSILDRSDINSLVGQQIYCSGRGNTQYDPNNDYHTIGKHEWREASFKITGVNQEGIMIESLFGGTFTPGDSGGPCFSEINRGFILVGLIQGGSWVTPKRLENGYITPISRFADSIDEISQ